MFRVIVCVDADVLDPSNCMANEEEKNTSLKVLEQLHKFPKVTGKWAGFKPNNNNMRYVVCALCIIRVLSESPSGSVSGRHC